MIPVTDDTQTPPSPVVREAVDAVELNLAVIVAVAANEVIGADGTIPWHLPEDLARFERLTTGHPVIMGRRTYDSIHEQLGEPLPNRTSVVCSRGDRSYPPRVVHAESVPAAIHAAATDADRRGVDRAFVAGGESIYRALLPVADRMYRTELTDAYDGDTRFPAFDTDRWNVIESDERDEFTFRTYVPD